MEVFNSNIKKFLIFSIKKAFFVFQQMEMLKKIPYISGNGTFLYFRKRKP